MTNEILNHLWQSTAFAALCAALTIALRTNRAHVRYALWTAASLKFLIPFSALFAVGRALGYWLLPPTAARQAGIVLDFVTQPIAATVVPVSTRVSAALVESAGSGIARLVPTVLTVLWIAGTAALAARWCVQWRVLAAMVRRAVIATGGRELEILRRLERQRHARRAVILTISEGTLEPGVFGVFAPRLLWPRAISAHLDDSQIEAILAHELSHVGRYDNLIAAVQMGVQAAFWFHPLVWWIGARLVDERERACDEDVLGSGSPADVYAESILKTCRFSIESPLPCVAGVTGADLKRRIEAIVDHRRADALNIAQRLLLAVAAAGVILGPISFGLARAPRLAAQGGGLRIGEEKFEVASVKANTSGDGPNRLQLQPGGRITAENIMLRNLIRFAFQVQDFQLIGGPDWIDKERFDIVAKAEHDIVPGPPGTVGPGQLMLRSLLADRFKLAVHQEKRELPVYALVLARSDGRLGPQLQRSTVDCMAIMNAARGRSGPPPMVNGRPQCGMRVSPGAMIGGGFPLSQLITTLSQFAQRTIVDRTGLTGDFDLELHWTPEQLPTLPPDVKPLAPVDPNGPSLFTAIQEQLGLKLESTKDSVDVLVIDKVERPSPD